ncbi:NAD(+)--rifampin ADP-ribosyltransferase, partial [Klebsiella pneumoniae]|uniref:NAD(+)--rifampin ADP-ribosyltransferase n=1 Tax=Klebsiella pneumoniae TaxID=573 RepID=UPI002730E0BB
MVKDWIPISHDNYKQVQGPFYHGTKANLAIGDLLTTGFISHFEDGRILKHIYFSAWHCCKVSDEAAFCLIQRPYISKTLLT